MFWLSSVLYILSLRSNLSSPLLVGNKKPQENSGQWKISRSLSDLKNHPYCYSGTGVTQITRWYICAVKNLDQSRLPTVLDKCDYRIWKNVLYQSYRQFDQHSNSVNPNFIGLMEHDLWHLQFDASALFQNLDSSS